MSGCASQIDAPLRGSGKVCQRVPSTVVGLVHFVGWMFVFPTAWAQFESPIYSVNVTSNVKYGEGELQSAPNLDLLMDIYSPVESTNTNRPAMVVVHGGSWINGNKLAGPLVSIANYLAARGFVCASINYRLTGNDPPSAPQFWQDLVGAFITEEQVRASYAGIVDTSTAVRYLRANAAALGINPDRIFAAGGSAGAFNVVHAGLDVASDYASTLPINNPAESPAIQLVIDHWGGFFRMAEVDPTDPPVLIIHGTEDATVPVEMSQGLDNRLTEEGVPHFYAELVGAGHSAWSATYQGQTLDQLRLDFILGNGDISYDPQNVYVDFNGASGGGSALSPFNRLVAGIGSVEPGGNIHLTPGTSAEVFSGGAALAKPATLRNNVSGGGLVRIGVLGERASQPRTGFVSRAANRD